MSEIKQEPSNTNPEFFETLASTIVERAAIAQRLGRSYWKTSGASRNVYEALGYPTSIDTDDYLAKYGRHEIARAVVDLYPNACWRYKPSIVDVEGIDSEFSKAWDNLSKKLKLFSYFKRLDKACGVGRFSVLYLGLDDSSDPRMPVTKKDLNLEYVSVYTEKQITINEWENDVRNSRYGLPKVYSLSISNEDRVGVSETIQAHYSRIIHVAENLLEDDVYGTPRLKIVFNRLLNLELIIGGSAEMFWQGSFPGYSFQAAPDARWDSQTKAQLEDEIEKYVHGFQRYLRLRGVDVKELGSTRVANPMKHFDVQMSAIAVGLGIPKSILMGSETAESSGEKDQKVWNGRVEERREDFCEAVIIQPFVDNCIRYGVLPAPIEEYEVVWPQLSELTELEKAEISERKTVALTKYASTPGADIVMPHVIFFKKLLGFSDSEIREIEEILGNMEQEEMDQINQDIEDE
ncbi:MAG: anti-CBASS protein Acb1 family protein [Candidatus Heimdallarchaeaceae archaeon]